MVETLVNSFIKDPAKMNFLGEDKDEKILYIIRRSIITNIGWAFASLFMFLAPVFFNPFLISLGELYVNQVTSFTMFIVNAFWYLFSFGFVFERFLNWFYNVNIITNKRIVDMDFNSLLSRHVSEAPLRNIEDITYTVNGTLQTLFKFGSVMIQTAAEQREFEFDLVPDPDKIQDILSDLVAQVKHYYGN